jgi:hypothetical protein
LQALKLDLEVEQAAAQRPPESDLARTRIPKPPTRKAPVPPAPTHDPGLPLPAIFDDGTEPATLDPSTLEDLEAALDAAPPDDERTRAVNIRTEPGIPNPDWDPD